MANGRKKKCRHFFVPDVLGRYAQCVYCGKRISLEEMYKYIYEEGEKK